MFLPLQVLAFATLPPQYRTDGASLFSLFRNIGAAIGVSVTSSMLAHNTQVLHEEIGASVTPFNRALQGGGVIVGRGTRHPAWRGDAGPGDQSAGPDHCLYRRLPDDDLHHAAVAALLLLLSRPKPSSPAAGKAHTAID